MKRNQLKVVFASLLMFTFLLIGCSKNNDDEPSYLTATVGHMNGFDFSTDNAEPTWENQDGYVISWQPDGGQSTTYPSNGGFLWWNTNKPGIANATKDMGVVAMSSVTQAPTSWEVAPNIMPLQIDHVYVAICRDGYVKFKVLSLNLTDWEANVEYVFSETSTFK